MNDIIFDNYFQKLCNVFFRRMRRCEQMRIKESQNLQTQLKGILQVFDNKRNNTASAHSSTERPTG